MSPALRRLFGCVTLLSFVSSLLVPVLTASHMAGDDDPACAPATSIAGDANAQLEEGAAPAARHCSVCHWLRAVATATPCERAALAHALPAAGAPPTLSSAIYGRLPVSGLTTRGPPAVHT